MRWRQVVGLYAVLGVLAVLYVVMEPPRPEIETDAPPARPKFLTVGRDDVALSHSRRRRAPGP